MRERVYLNLDKIEIPQIHNNPVHKILNSISFIGMLLAIWATVEYSIWRAILGIVMALGKKLVFR